MPRRKRHSEALETARRRIAGVKTITPLPAFGGSLDLAQYEEKINALGAQLGRYNDALTLLDGLGNDIAAGEKELRGWNRRVLAAVGAHYGTDSNQYEAAGGTRDSEHKRGARRSPGDTGDGADDA